MDFFVQNRFYRLNVILLTAIGQWPYQSNKWQRLQQILIYFSIFSVIIVQGIKMFCEWGDIDIMIQCFTPMSSQMVACIKSINSMSNRHKMTELLIRMKSHWSSLTNEKEIKILEKYAEDGRILTLSYASFLLITATAYVMIPMMPQILNVISPLNESRPLTFLYPTEYFIDEEKHFYIITLHTYTASILTSLIIVAVDTMFTTYVQHACGILAVIGYRLEESAENIDLIQLKINVEIEQDSYYWQLRNCIKDHQEAIKFAMLVESSYSNAFLFQLSICMSTIIVTMLQILMKFGQYEEMYRIIQFTLAQLFHLFFNSLPGQKLMNQSADFSRSIYCAGWYGFSLRSRNLIKIVMLGATTPLKITASKLYEMSMENFGKFLQTSISYFTVLASLR